MFRCPNKNCNSELEYVESIKKYVCNNCNQMFSEEKLSKSLEETGEIKDNKLVHFNSMDEIKLLAEKVINKYPAVISEEMQDLLYNCRDYREKCDCLKRLYYTTTKIIALVCISYYLQDANASADRKIQEKSTFAVPFDSTWKNIIAAVSEYYKNTDETSFHIDDFIEKTDNLMSKANGYKNGITGSIINIHDTPLSILQAGVEIRNAIQHDYSVRLREEHYEEIYPYYLDIVMSILKEYDFLDGSRYCLLSYNEDNSFELLHGTESRFIHIEITDLEQCMETSNIGLYDTEINRFYPLYPFILKLQDVWNREKEFIFSSTSSKKAVFNSRKTGSINESHEAYKQIKFLSMQKKIDLNTDLSKIDYYYFITMALEMSESTLANGYLGKKYFPECYVAKKGLKSLVEDFMVSNSTALMFTGEAGIGKSAFLCEIVNNYLKERRETGISKENTQSRLNVIPVFINGRDIKKDSNNSKPVFNIIKENFLLKSDIEHFEYFIMKLDEIIKKERGLKENTKILFVIDAVNEAYSSKELFNEIDGFINSVYSNSEKKIKYPWLKVIYSMRSTGLNDIWAGKKSDETLFRNENLYYFSQAEGKEEERSPVNEISELNEEEVKEAFLKYATNRRHFPLLSSMKLDTDAIQDKIPLLSSPLYLRFYLNILEKNNGKAPFIGQTAEALLAEYYNMLTEGETNDNKETKHFLNSICKIMKDKTQAAYVETEDIADLVEAYKRDAELRKELFYNSPFERLLSEGVLDRKIVLEPGEGRKEIINFTQQKFHEYSMMRYLLVQYGEPSKEMLGLLLNKNADFDEYNAAVSMIMEFLWQQKRISEVAQISVTDNEERYRNVFRAAIFEKASKAVKSKVSKEALDLILSEFKDRIELFVSEVENLKYIEDVAGILLWGGVDEFYHNIGGRLFSVICLEAANKVYNLLGNDIVNQCTCLFYIGNLNKSIGNVEKALSCYKEAESLCKNISEESSSSSALSLVTGRIYLDIGDIYIDSGKVKEAYETFNNTMVITEKLLLEKPKNRKLKNLLGSTCRKIGKAMKISGNNEGALEYFLKFLKIKEDLSNKYPDNTNYLQGLSVAYSEVASIYKIIGDTDKALDYYEKELEIKKIIIEREPNNAQYSFGLGAVYHKLGNLYKDFGKMDDALLYFEQDLVIQKKLYESDPENIEYANSLGTAYSRIGALFLKRGERSKALEFYKKNVEIKEELASKYPDNVTFRSGLGVAFSKTGTALKDTGELSEALNFFVRDCEIQEELVKKEPYNVKWKSELGISYSKIGNIYKAQKEYELAIDYYNKYKEIHEELAQKNLDYLEFYNQLGVSYGKLADMFKSIGNLDKALEHYEKLRDMHMYLLKKYASNVGYKNTLSISYGRLGDIHKRLGDHEKAFENYKEYLRLKREVVQESPLNVDYRHGLGKAYARLGEILKKKGSYKEAVELYELAADIREKLALELEDNEENNKYLKGAYSDLIKIYGYIGEKQKKSQCREKLKKLGAASF